MQPAILDTDILSEMLKLRNPVVQQRAVDYSKSYHSFAFLVITRYEVMRGYKARNALEQVARFAAFCTTSVVVPLDEAIFDRAADLWAIARNNGHPCNDADLLIAATAIEHDRVLVTGNSGHFRWIRDLVLDDWREPLRDNG